MIIQLIDDANKPAYDELARTHGTLFNRLEWLALFGAQMRPLGIFDDKGKMIGGLSLYQERRWGMKILRRAPFTPTCGPFLAVKSQSPVAGLEHRRRALKSMVDFLEKENAAICMLPLDQAISDILPFFWHGYKAIPYYTYIIDLTPPLDAIQKNMSSAQRNHISKAQKDLLTVQRTEDMEIVRDLVLATFDRQKKDLNRNALDAILFQYANRENSFAFTTYRATRPIATCFVVHGQGVAYDLLAGYRAEERHHGAGPLAVYAAIKYAKELGLKTFDFEGSVIPAIETYFRGFGGKLIPYFTVNKAWLPLELALKVLPGLRNRF